MQKFLNLSTALPPMKSILPSRSLSEIFRLYWFIVLGLTLSVSLPAGVVGADLKVAVADVNRVFNEFYKTREAADVIQDELATVRREINERMAVYKQLVDEINRLMKEASELSPELGRAKRMEADEKKSEMQSLERQISQHQERRQRQIETEQATKRRDLFAQIFGVVGAKSKEKGFDLVFDKSGAGLSQMPMLLHANPETIYDLTEEVIAELNKDAPAGFIPGAPATLPEPGVGVPTLPPAGE